MSAPPTPAERVASAVQLACLLEASAPKPGNVSPGRDFHDTTYADFLASAAAIGPAFLAAGGQPVGATVLAAVQATRAWTRANTNLGIILLLAPLARAAARHAGLPLREAAQVELAALTVEDAELAYEAIRVAAPGGLGSAPTEDVATRPTVTLREAMRLAAGRDGVAAEYVTGYARTFGTGAPAIARALEGGLGWSDAVVEGYLALLAEAPDTLVARKLGPAAAEAVRRDAAAVLAVGGTRTEAGRRGLASLDAALRDPANRRNPGTTADLTAAALFVVIIEREWSVRPRR